MSDAMTLLGQTLAGKYLLRRVLGEGAMGAVYEAQHIEIGKRVAVKVIAKDLGAFPEMAARFKREARAASAVESEHIVQVFDIGEDPTAGLYMVMEHVTGEDLATRLEREAHLDLGTTIVIGTQVARGLAKAHAAGVIHRDLKPANIFLSSREDGSLLTKVLDFGISKFIREETDRRYGKLTVMGTAVGTAEYMSPEQAQGFESVDARSDVWSFGAVLYECLAGKGPYQGFPNYEQTIIAIVTKKAAPLQELAPWVPQCLADVVDRTLLHDPAARYADCSELSRVLADVSFEMFPDGASGMGSRGSFQQPSRPSSRKALVANPGVGTARASDTREPAQTVLPVTPRDGTGEARALTRSEMFGETVALASGENPVASLVLPAESPPPGAAEAPAQPPPAQPSLRTPTIEGVALAKPAPTSPAAGAAAGAGDETKVARRRKRSPVVIVILPLILAAGLSAAAFVVLKSDQLTAKAHAAREENVLSIASSAPPVGSAPASSSSSLPAPRKSPAGTSVTGSQKSNPSSPTRNGRGGKSTPRVAPASVAPSASTVSAAKTPPKPSPSGNFGGTSISDNY